MHTPNDRFAGKLIHISFILNIVLMFVMAGVYVVLGVSNRGSRASSNFYMAIIFAILGALYIFFYFNWRSRFPFAKIMLKTVTSITGKFPATIFAGIIGVILETAFSALTIITVIGIVLKYNGTTQSGALYALLVFVAFAFYWTTQVIKNTVHVTVAGLFATYYFMGTAAPDGTVTLSVSNPTAGAAKRALTTSFGSICFGSLVIALIQTLRAILRSAAQNAAEDGNFVGAFCAVCVECCLSYIDALLQYFNLYAFTEVAIYGKDYCSAAKATWELVKSKGIDAIINDSLIGNVLGLGGLFIGLVCAALGYGYSVLSTTIPDEPSYFVIIALVSFFIGLSEFAILAAVIESGVATTFVCLAEDPEALRRTKPQLFEKILQVYPEVQLGYY
ncbi:putative choline transporter, neither null mutation nor overexpression affects choline transport [Quaeritorhiza haematococci]|nr:putative choline transporter, neither null mutation nor overexpression affects choline transport [Quaeritorhiza haematococci]